MFYSTVYDGSRRPKSLQLSYMQTYSEEKSTKVKTGVEKLEIDVWSRILVQILFWFPKKELYLNLTFLMQLDYKIAWGLLHINKVIKKLSGPSVPKTVVTLKRNFKPEHFVFALKFCLCVTNIIELIKICIVGQIFFMKNGSKWKEL